MFPEHHRALEPANIYGVRRCFRSEIWGRLSTLSVTVGVEEPLTYAIEDAIVRRRSRSEVSFAKPENIPQPDPDSQEIL